MPSATKQLFSLCCSVPLFFPITTISYIFLAAISACRVVCYPTTVFTLWFSLPLLHINRIFLCFSCRNICMLCRLRPSNRFSKCVFSYLCYPLTAFSCAFLVAIHACRAGSCPRWTCASGRTVSRASGVSGVPGAPAFRIRARCSSANVSLSVPRAAAAAVATASGRGFAMAAACVLTASCLLTDSVCLLDSMVNHTISSCKRQ